tara:strand:+ start:266 stop:1276 length:1011 start_codon:yes stop_codon:yes gene_type:complete
MRLEIIWRKGWAHIHGTAPDGTRVRQSARTRDAKQAEEQRAALEAKLWKAHHYGPESVMTFDDGALQYAKAGKDTRFLLQITKQLQGVKLKDVDNALAHDTAKKLYPSASNATLNRQVITPIRAVMNYCAAHHRGPLVRITSYPITKPKRKAVGPEYLEKMRPHLPKRLYVLMLFLHQTGRRVSDAVGMEPSWIDGRSVQIPKTKNGDPAHVIMTDHLADLVNSLEPRHGRVFGYTRKDSIYPTLRRAAKKAGVEYLGTHQPGRHSFATTLHDAGWQSSAIAAAGGWKSVRLVADTYEHPTEAQYRAADVFTRQAGTELAQSKKNYRKPRKLKRDD